MWVLSVDAGSLLSVVKFDQKKAGAKALAEKHGATDPGTDYMLVRARIKASLGYVADVLEAIYLGEVEGWERPIVESMPSADYKYRTIITRDEWKKFVCFEIDGIDYDSHVKEETVRRQPEPKVKNLYTALSATWSAWAKLQDTPPYGGYSGNWSKKPDCKNCDHTELRHSVKGDRCNAGWVYKGGKQVPENEHACQCEKYEPKPVPVPAPPALPAGKSAEDSAAVFEGEQVYPSAAYGSLWDEYMESNDPLTAEDDDLVTEAWAVDEQGVAHHAWCSVWDGDGCICVESNDDEWEGSIRTIKPAVLEMDLDAVIPEDGTVVPDIGVWVSGQLVEQEAPVAGETRKERKARNERNRRARRRARLAPAAR